MSKIFQGVTLGGPQAAEAMRMRYNDPEITFRQPTVSDKAGQVAPENVAAMAAAAAQEFKSKHITQDTFLQLMREAVQAFKSKHITQDTFLQLMREAVQARNSPDAVGAWGAIFRGKHATRDELAATCMQALLVAAVKDAGPDVLSSAIDSLVFSGAGKRISELSYFMADQMIAARDPATKATMEDRDASGALYFGAQAQASGNPLKVNGQINIQPVSSWQMVMGPKGATGKKLP